MKKYLTTLLLLTLIVFGFGASKAEAGLSSAQTQAVLNLLAGFNANTATIQAVQNALLSTGNSSSTGTTAGGTAPGQVNPNAQYPYGTTPTSGNPTNTTTPTTPSTPSGPSANGCYSNQTAVYPYNVNNGYPCVKACPVLTANANMNYWNVVTNSLCPIYTPSTSVTLNHPNGGEVFTPGSETTLKWETENISASNDNVFILLNYYDANNTFVTNTVLSQDENNDGYEVVTFPDTLPSGTMWGAHFKISVGITDDNGNSLGSDYSDDFFTIE